MFGSSSSCPDISLAIEEGYKVRLCPMYIVGHFGPYCMISQCAIDEDICYEAVKTDVAYIEDGVKKYDDKLYKEG